MGQENLEENSASASSAPRRNSFTEFLGSLNDSMSYATNKEDILSAATSLTTDRLHQILKKLPVNDYKVFLDDLNQRRKLKNKPFLSFEQLANIFKDLETENQAIALSNYCSAQKDFSMILLSNHLKPAQAVVRITVIKQFHEKITTLQAFTSVLDCLEQPERIAMQTDTHALHFILQKNKKLPEILDSKINHPELSENERTSKLFLKVYQALRSMASFSFLRSNSWKDSIETMQNEKAVDIMDQLRQHEMNKPASRTAQALKLVTAIPLGLNENGLVLETIKAGFKTAPLCSSVKLDGQTFFRHASLVKYLKTRKESSPLTGETVETVRQALGFR